MSFVPKINVTIANNRCWCCEDNSVKPQPRELAVFYSEKDGKFHAKLNRDDFDVLYKDLIERTKRAIQEFLEAHYTIVSSDIPDGYRAVLSSRLPSLEEVYNIERMASEVFARKSSNSVDALDSSSPGSPRRISVAARHTPIGGEG